MSDQSGFAAWRGKVWHWRRKIIVSLVGSVTHARTDRMEIALTFDDGPHPQFTPLLLETLVQYDAKATFFVTGEQAARYPALVERIYDEGHTLACHSWDHTSFRTIGLRAQWQQISRWQAVIGSRGSRVFRPPYGHQTPLTHLLIRLRGYRVVLWNAICQDWLDHDAATLLSLLEGKIKAGTIVLLHDNLIDVLDAAYLDRQPTLTAVTFLLTQYSPDFRFVTVPELLRPPAKPGRKLVFGMPPAGFLDKLQRTEHCND